VAGLGKTEATMNVRTRAVAPLALVGLLGIAGVQDAAFADSPTCASPGYFSAWSKTGRVKDSSCAFGQWFNQSLNSPGLGGYVDGRIENNDSSGRNTSTSHSVHVYEFQGFGTYIICWVAGSAGNNPAGPADQGSSHTWQSNNGC
jgi:hypothetical protein